MNNMTVGSIRTTVTPPLTSGIYEALLEKAEQECNNLQDQRDFAMGEIERLKRERDNYRQALESLLYSTEEWVNSHVPANQSLDFIKKINTRIRKQLRGVWK